MTATQEAASSQLVDLRAINTNANANQKVFFRQTHHFGAHLNIEHYELGNGLRVLLVSDESAPVVAYHTWFRVGSRDERQGKTGIAHLFEHLMFNETESLPKGEFDRRLEAVGAESNASTWVDYTQYNIAAPSRELPLLIEIEADRMQNLVLREPQVESEKEVVANERRYRVDDDVEGAMSETLWSNAFSTHPYHWPTIGWMEDILAFTTEDCAQFYRTFYAPNNATLVLVGDFSHQDALTRISKAYGAIAPSNRPKPTYPKEGAQTEARQVVLTKPTATEKVSIGYRAPALSERDHIVGQMLCEVLSGGRASRLYRKLIREMELASEVRVSITPFSDPGLFEVYASGREGIAAEALIELINSELELLRRDGVTQAELDRAQSRFELGLLHGLETADGKANTIGFYDCLLQQPGAAFDRMQECAKVTPADVQRVARTYLNPKQSTCVIVRPSGEEVEDDAAEPASEP
jgi:zinc protease